MLGITLEEYVRATWEGALPDYVDGEIVERNVGENQHSQVQIKLVLLLAELANARRIHLRSELTMRVAPTRIRIADLAIFEEAPTEAVPTRPPLVVVEILSREDRHAEIIRKFEDYRKWGVPCIWLLDPIWRKLHTYTDAGLAEVPSLLLPEFGVEIKPADLSQDV